MPKCDEKTLKCNHGEKSLKGPFVIYLDLECLLEKILLCQNNPNNSYNEIFRNCSFDKDKSKLEFYRGRDCIKEL